MKRLNKRKSLIFIGLLVIDGLFFTLTNPGSVKAIFLFVGFILLISTIYLLIEGVITLLKWYGLPLKHKKRLVRLLSGFSAIILGLQSLGELNLREVLIITPLFILSYIYLGYQKLPG